MIIAIIAGSIVVGMKGFRYSLENSNHKRFEIILESPYDEKEMKDIVKSVIKDNHSVRTSSLFIFSFSKRNSIADHLFTFLFVISV